MLCMLHGHVGLSRPFYVNKIYSFIHRGAVSWNALSLIDRIKNFNDFKTKIRRDKL